MRYEANKIDDAAVTMMKVLNPKTGKCVPVPTVSRVPPPSSTTHDSDNNDNNVHVYIRLT